MKSIEKILMLLLAVVAMVSCQKDPGSGVGDSYGVLKFESYNKTISKDGGVVKLKMITDIEKPSKGHAIYHQEIQLPAFWSAEGVSCYSGADKIFGCNNERIDVPGNYSVFYYAKKLDTKFVSLNQLYASESPDGGEYLEITIKPNTSGREITIFVYVPKHSIGGGQATLSFTQKGD